MKTPKDEMMSTSEEDRQRMRDRRARVGRWTVITFLTAVGIVVLWTCSSCTTQPMPESPLAREIRQRHDAKVVKKALGDMQDALRGAVWSSNRTGLGGTELPPR